MLKLIIERPVEIIEKNDGLKLIINHKRYIKLVTKKSSILLRRGQFSMTPEINLTKEELLKIVSEVEKKNTGWELQFSNNEYILMDKKQVSYLKNLLEN